MASLVTPQFERYIAEQTIQRGTVLFDEFIFANIPGLTDKNLSQHLTMPAAAHIVHRQPVSQSGVINENAVVYSVTIGTEIGDFDFNFIGLVNKSKNLLAVAVQTAPVKKIRNKNAVQGNSITRNILLEFSGAKALTNINVAANTWQIDFTVRLHGIDEKIRLVNRDLYGRAVFFANSFLVQRETGNQYHIQPGIAYVEGVRMAESAQQRVTASRLPCSIYADVVHHCTVTGAYETEIRYLTQHKDDYLDSANRQHYVQILADIDSRGNVTDRRLLSPFLGINPQDLDEHTNSAISAQGHTHRLPLASLSKRGIVQIYNGVDSARDDVAATAHAAKTAYDKGAAAQTAAYNAQRTANDGVNKANAAQTTANSAVTKADNAQRTANDGVNKANAAQHAADNAQRTANAAQQTATNANNNADGRVSKEGDTMSGQLTVPKVHLTENGTGESLKIGDDAWLGDVNTANAVGIKGQGDQRQGYLVFGTNKKRFGFDGVNFIADAAIFSPAGFTSTANYGAFRIAAQGYDLRMELENGRFKFWNHQPSTNQAFMTYLPRKNGELLVDGDFTYQKIGDFEIRKYPDGTMIQTCRFNPPNNRVGAQDKKFTFNWAVAFVEKPKIFIQHQNHERSGYGSLDMVMNTVEHETTNSQVAFWVWEWYYNNNLISFDFLAIGRWKR